MKYQEQDYGPIGGLIFIILAFGVLLIS